MRLLVSGGRDNADGRLIRQVLDLYHTTYHFRELIHGDARGTDRIAKKWAEKHRLKITSYPVTPNQWTVWGKKAGIMRNATMLKEDPDIIIIFPGGNGTLDMLKRAIKYQKNVNPHAVVVNVGGEPITFAKLERETDDLFEQHGHHLS